MTPIVEAARAKCRSRSITRFSSPSSRQRLRGFDQGQRVSQLAYRNAQQLQLKLVWFYSGWLEDVLVAFDPPMD